MMQPIEIFRPGTHTASGGQVITFSAADLAGAAAAYDPKLHEAPIVVGHPAVDGPAYGWVGSLSIAGGNLVAAPLQIDAAFAEMVQAGRFKHVSASFYTPTAATNPTPGSYYLRHVGFLGAQPPAVKGLKPVSFAEVEDGVVEFSDGWTLGVIARMFRGLRDLVITQFGQDRADAALPSDAIDQIAASAVVETLAPDQSNPVYVEQSQETELTTQTAAALAAREETLRARELQFAEREAEIRRAGDATFLDGLIGAGRVLPAAKSAILSFMAHLDATEIVSFGEGAPRTSHAAFRDLLATLPKAVEFREIGGGDAALVPDTASFTEVIAAADAYQAAQKIRGIEVSNIDAVAHVTKGKVACT